MRPEFKAFVTPARENEIFDLIHRLIQTLQSPEIAIDERHTPRLHARFLTGLLSRYKRDVATTGGLHTQPPPSQEAQFEPGPSDMQHTTHSGPTGSGKFYCGAWLEIHIDSRKTGKTLLVRTLARILDVPFSVSDATSFTQVYKFFSLYRPLV